MTIVCGGDPSSGGGGPRRPTASENCQRTEQIKFSGRDMVRLPEHITKCETLKILDFSNNCLGRCDDEELVRNFSGLKRLIGLNLSSNELKSWPSFLSALTSLEVLSLCGNELEVIPESAASFNRLQRLHLDFNHIKLLPVSWNVMTSLTSLTLSNNRLKEIPPSLWTLTSLRTLDLRKNRISVSNLPSLSSHAANRLRHLILSKNCLKGSLDLSELTNLSVLDVSHNELEELNIESLDRLESLNCSHNQVKALKLHGAALRLLAAENNELEVVTCSSAPNFLEKLNLSHNCLKELPNWILLSKFLRYLSADHNQITSILNGLFDSAVNQLSVVKLNHNLLDRFPNHISHCAVRELYLQYNNIQEIPDNFFAKFSCLQILNLSYNQIQHLPPVCKCPNLRCAVLTGNRFTDVSSLESLFRQPTLTTLHLADNCIKLVPDNFFNNCPSLDELSLACNQLQYLSSHVTRAKRLRKLFLHSNMLKSVPLMTQLANLRLLDVANNDLSDLEMESLIPKNLTYLDLSANSRLSIDPGKFQSLCAQRSVAIVDINSAGISKQVSDGGNNISSVNEDVLRMPWCLGFTETEEGNTRLYIELPKEVHGGQHEALLVFIEADDDSLASQLRRALPGFLRVERECEETSPNYLRNVLLSSVRFLRAKGQSHNLGITMCQLSGVANTASVAMRLATFGKPSSCILGRSGNAIILAQREECSIVDADEWMDVMKAADVCNTNQFGPGPVTCSPRGSWASVPDPEVKELVLSVQDKFVVFGDSTLSRTISAEEVCRIVHGSRHPVAAAKALSEVYASVTSGRRECVAVISLVGSLQQKLELEDAEKYRCWEFMLEQNHKLLFTKELETIQKTIAGNGHQRIGNEDPSSWYSSAFSKYRCPLPSHRGRYYCYGNKCN